MCFPIYASVCVESFTVFVNCLLNALAICMDDVIVLSLKANALFWVVLVLLARPCIVFQIVCVLCCDV